MLLGSTANVLAATVEESTEAAAPVAEIVEEKPAENRTEVTDTQEATGTDASVEAEVPEASVEDAAIEEAAPQEAQKEEAAKEETPKEETAQEEETAPKEEASAKDEVLGTVTLDNVELAGTVELEVEEDKNDDQVEIKESDKPYLALGANLSAEQQAIVLSLMGIDPATLGDYEVLYVTNDEEHQYLDSYIDSSKIGTRSLSSVVIVEREKGNGINISTKNISYCTVGMYKNALATAGIQDADIIVAGPTAISGTAALVGIFKTYTEMTGETIDEESVDAALNELVVTGALEASTGADADEVEAMIAYIKQAVVEHDLTNEADIREAIEEGCKEFGVTLTEEDIQELINLMLKISELDLDLEGLLNSAQSIYDKIQNADSGFWAKIGDLIDAIVEAIKNIFS
ncbi:MAG: DUF1002 domain-containing protein [Lachnospiraceae bacterium]|nr:DUF1002 domain-containing protein [Lachnospiraceae bacterium]